MNAILTCVWLLSSVGLVRGQDVRHLKWGGVLVAKADTPPPAGSSILWKISSNKVMEYDKDFPDQGITSYGAFKGRTTLDRTTGELKVSSLTKADNGVYSVEYNSKTQPKTFSVGVFKEVSRAAIQPLSLCTQGQLSCTLTCDGGDTTDAGVVTYGWKKDGEPLNVSDPTLQITSKEPVWFTCQLENPVGRVESKPTYNPLAPGGSNVGTKFGIATAVIIVLGIVAGAVYFVAVNNGLISWCQKKEEPLKRGIWSW